jgi:DNA helicase II / ATP-dependent DNA helicase PcrA
VEAKSPFGGAYQTFGGAGAYGRPNPYGKSRFEDQPAPYESTYQTPGWQRAQQHWKGGDNAQSGNGGGKFGGNFQSGSYGAAKPKFQVATSVPKKRAPVTLEGELIAASSAPGMGFRIGDRILHQKLGTGTIAEVDGNKLTIDFDDAGRKRVVDSFVDRA